MPDPTIPERFGQPEPMRENLVRSLPGVELRATDGASDGRIGTLFGRLVNYGVWAEVNSPVEGHFLERTMPGAFSKTFAENRSRMQVIFDHGQDRAIGRKPLGPLEDVFDGPDGIDYTAALIDTSYNRDLAPGLRSGVYGNSYRFSVPRGGDSWNYKPGRSAHNPEGIPERTVTQAKVVELGPTPFPVGMGTSAGLRAATDDYLARTLASDPARLALLMRSLGAEPAHPEPPGGTEAPPHPVEAPPPVEEARATQDPPTGGSLDSKETPPVSFTIPATRDAILARRSELVGLISVERPVVLSEDETRSWNDQTAELAAIDAALKADDERRSFIASIAPTQPAPADRGAGPLPGSWQPPTVNVARQRVSDPYNLDEIRSAARDEGDRAQLLRDSAMRSLETSSFPNPNVDADAARSEVQRLLDYKDSPDKELATRMLQTGNPHYRSAFDKLVIGRQLSPDEQRAAAIAVVGTTTTGGYAVPYQFDPTIIRTGAYTTINPYRAICRVEQIVGGNVWRGVSAGAIAAQYRAEGAAMTEGGPTFALPSYTAQRADAFVTLSREALADRPDLGAELSQLIDEGKATNEENQFSIGVGTTVYPHGMFVKGKFTVKETITNDTFAVADLDATEADLPIRHRAEAVWMLSRGVIRIIQGWETAYGKLFNSTLGYPAVGNPAQNPGGNTGLSLLGYPVWETPSAPTTVTTDDTIVGILVSPKNYIIVDRVGMEVEIIPNMFDASTGFPTGQRGLQAFWRNTAGPLNADAGRQININ